MVCQINKNRPSFSNISTKFVALLALAWPIHIFIRLCVLLVITSGLFDYSTISNNSPAPSPVNLNDYDKQLETILMEKDSATTDPPRITFITSLKDGSVDNSKRLVSLDVLDPANIPVTFLQTLIVGVFLIIIHAPQMYGAVELYKATDCKISTSRSIALAFVHQKIQFVAVIIELIIVGIAYSSVSSNFLLLSCYTNLMGLICIRLITLLVVFNFIHLQLKKIGSKKGIKRTPPESCVDTNVKMNLWNVDTFGAIKGTEKNGELGPDEIIIVTKPTAAK